MISIPAFNEERTLRRVISGIPKELPGCSEISIVVFDDGSTDNTSAEAKAAGVTVIRRNNNVGLSQTFQSIINTALRQGADILVNIDADGQFDPNDITRLTEPILSGRADFVTASRFMDERLIPRMPLLKRFGNRFVARLISVLTGRKFYDVSCGFRAYSREALLHLNLFGKYTYTHETFLNIAFKEMDIEEVPLVVKGEREYGQSKVASNLWRYGYHMVNTIFRTMLDYKPLKFFGWGGSTVFIIGLGMDIFIFFRFILLHSVTPFKTIGFAGLFLNVFGLLVLIVGLLADMINKTRQTQERLLYISKKDHFGGSRQS
ncbi:MAG: glycosyltransferase family 2 protein [Patescibacteria group bacterium]